MTRRSHTLQEGLSLRSVRVGHESALLPVSLREPLGQCLHCVLFIIYSTFSFISRLQTITYIVIILLLLLSLYKLRAYHQPSDPDSS